MGGGLGDIVKTVSTGGLSLIFDALKPADQPKAPTTPDVVTKTAIGAGAEGGAKTFDEADSKRKSVKKKKLGARGLQIPLQSTDTSSSQGVSSTTTGTGGLSI